jgi:hypothetical protein
MSEYKYLQQRDILQAGDEYHQCGSGPYELWLTLTAKSESVGHPKRKWFSHHTRVRRRTGPAHDGNTQQEMF